MLNRPTASRSAAMGTSAFEAEPEIFCSIRALPVVTDAVEKGFA
jgi:hypothetical protein